MYDVVTKWFSFTNYPMRMCGFRGFCYATQWRPRPWKRSIGRQFFMLWAFKDATIRVEKGAKIIWPFSVKMHVHVTDYITLKHISDWRPANSLYLQNECNCHLFDGNLVALGAFLQKGVIFQLIRERKGNSLRTDSDYILFYWHYLSSTLEYPSQFPRQIPAILFFPFSFLLSTLGTSLL
jgi:hypothetical protein